MNYNMNTLIEQKNVISIAAQVIAGALEAGAEVRDEENKQEIQMQNLEGVSSSPDAINVNIQSDQQQEEKTPLLQNIN